MMEPMMAAEPPMMEPMMEPMMAAEPPMMEPAMMPAEESSEMLETGHPEPMTAAMPEESMMEADMMVEEPMMDPMMPPMMAAMPMMSAEMMPPAAMQTMMPAESQEASLGRQSDPSVVPTKRSCTAGHIQSFIADTGGSTS